MTVVERVFKENELPESSRAFARDTVTLGWEDRTHAHGRRRTDGGVEFGTSLPRGSVLRDGDCFVLDAERLVVAVVERAEPVFVIEPRSAPEWALFAYHIGNRHQPVMITDGARLPGRAGHRAAAGAAPHAVHARTLPFTPAATVAGHQH